MKRVLIDTVLGLPFYIFSWVFWLAPSSWTWTETKTSWCSMHSSIKIIRIFQTVVLPYLWGLLYAKCLLSLGSWSDPALFFFQPPGIPMTGFLRMLGQRNKKKSESRSSQQQAELLNPTEGILQGISCFAWNSNLTPLLNFYIFRLQLTAREEH